MKKFHIALCSQEDILCYQLSLVDRVREKLSKTLRPNYSTEHALMSLLYIDELNEKNENNTKTFIL